MVLLTGDFNSEITEPCINSLLYQNDMTSVAKDKTCIKSNTNPTCTDRFLTNSNLSLQHTKTVSTGLSRFSYVSSYCFKDLFFKKETWRIRIS